MMDEYNPDGRWSVVQEPGITDVKVDEPADKARRPLRAVRSPLCVKKAAPSERARKGRNDKQERGRLRTCK